MNMNPTNMNMNASMMNMNGSNMNAANMNMYRMNAANGSLGGNPNNNYYNFNPLFNMNYNPSLAINAPFDMNNQGINVPKRTNTSSSESSVDRAFKNPEIS